MLFGVANDPFIIFIAAIFVIILSSLYILAVPSIGHVLPVIWLVSGSVICFGGFLVFDALRTRRQYPAVNNGIVLAFGGFIVLIGFSVLWFVYFVKWD